MKIPFVDVGFNKGLIFKIFFQHFPSAKVYFMGPTLEYIPHFQKALTGGNMIIIQAAASKRC